jgi:diadenosine tetraphosphate (Ap4A) HIT family hydrolase
MAYERDNIFAQILRHELPSERVFEDDEFVAFRDIAPQAPVHIVLIPRGEPPPSAAQLTERDAEWVGRMVVRAARIAAEEGLAEEGYRLVMNSGALAGQTVEHFHMHILGGGELGRLA